MREVFRKLLKRMLAGVIQPAPSLFDICIAGVLYINFLNDAYQKQVFFIFYTILLLSMTFVMKQKRNYTSTPLTLFILAGLMGVFTHSYLIYQDSITFRYLNLYLLAEGFLYILFGGIFLITAIRYSKNLKFIFLLLPIVFYPYFKDVLRLTIVCAGLISFGVYYLMKKKFKILIPLCLISFLFMIRFWHRLVVNFSCRPYLWKELWAKIIQRPFIGHGFNKALTPDNMTFSSYWGWLYNHNDYLAIWSYLGVLSVITIIAFNINTLKRIGINVYFPIFLTLCIVPFFQMTMFDIGKATGYLLITILCITQTHFKEEQNV